MPYYGLYIPAKGGSSATSANASSPAVTVPTNGIVVNINNGLVSHNVDEFQETVTSPYVFQVKCKALEVLKLHKDARLREFISEDDAVKYAQTGYEVVQSKYADVKTPTANLEQAAFRAPTKQKLVEFRKMIESGNYDRVKETIWENPRYLVSSGDTPTSLKEGCRYNAMHVCAIAKQPRIAELILQTVSDPKFVDLLTGKKNDDKMCKELCKNLLDYYLNMPEKGRSETPLHFAAKFGSIEMVEVLTSYPECKMRQNSDGDLPKDIICSRAPASLRDNATKIEMLLEDRFYVPVLRSMDNAIPPQIGEPFSAASPPNLNCDPLSPEVKIQALAGPMSKEKAKKFCRRWKTPPRLGSAGSSPIVHNPYISPRKGRSANATPNRSGLGLNNSPTHTLQRRSLFTSSPLSKDPMADPSEDVENMLVFDKENGDHGDGKDIHDAPIKILHETNNNEESINTHRTPIKSQSHSLNLLKSSLVPNTPLLKMKMDLFFTYREQYQDSPLGIFSPNANKCNSSQANGDWDHFDTPGYKERHIKITDTEKGLEIIGRELAKEQNVEWREYWDFLPDFINIASSEGLEKLENFFAQRAKEAERAKKPAKAAAIPPMMNDVCSALEKLCCSKDTADGQMLGRNGIYDRNRYESGSLGGNVTSSNATTPYTCVEKSLQVFAKRMTKTILHNIENLVSINDTLISELKRLKSLICSFKEDPRFFNVDFIKVHSRFGNLITIYLLNSKEVTPEVKSKINLIIQNLAYTPGERREHVECVCSRIIFMLNQPRVQSLPENLKSEEMCSQAWQEEEECECQWEVNLSRKTSRRQRMESRYKTHQIKQQEKGIKSITTDQGQLLNNEMKENNESSEDSDEDVFWSDFGASDTDDDEVWLTPPENLSRRTSVSEPSDRYDIFVYGNEPTKRDLDVLNAILHVDLNPVKHAHIIAWKKAMLSYPTEEMDYFPSPAIIKKSHSFTVKSSPGKQQYLQLPKLQIGSKLFNSTPEKQSKPNQSIQLPIVKRLFMSPSQTKTSSIVVHQQFTTPLNKVRGLFSSYRESKDISTCSEE